MKFLTLTELEFKKVLPFLIGLFGAAFFIHVAVFFRSLTKIKESYTIQAMEARQSLEEYLSSMQVSLAMYVDQAVWPMLILFLAAMIFLVYGVVTWYKEWFGMSKRIYMLLSIRGSRMRIFFSKLVPFAFGIILFNGVLLLSIFADAWLMKKILPIDASVMSLMQDVIANSAFYTLLFPQNMLEFLYLFLFAVMMFTIMTVFVLTERSKRIWGGIGGFIYGAATVALFIYYKTLPLFSVEEIYADWGFVIGITFLSTAISYYLLKKRISI